MQYLKPILSWAVKLTAVCILSILIFPSGNSQTPDPNLIMLKNGLICSINSGEPYTGKVSGVIDARIIEYNVVKGIKNGNFCIFSESGKKLVDGEMKNNKNEGLWQYFYPDGTLESQGYFKNDQVNDKWFWYYPDGKLKTSGGYLNGKKNGKWTIYDESGKVISEGVYRNDKVVANIKDSFT
jgi:antitoxin component YwqK of YwqJK toxin-antitoxin module